MKRVLVVYLILIRMLYKYLLAQNNQAIHKEFAEALNCSQKTISNQLRTLGKV